MKRQYISLGVLATALTAVSCERRSAARICEEASKFTTIGPLVKSIGPPDRATHNDAADPQPVEWWGYDGSDGVCIVTIAKNAVGPDPAFLHSYKDLASHN